MLRAHRIRLAPTNKQATALLKACGVARYTWNWALEQCFAYYAEHKKMIDLKELKKRWNAEKPTWVYESPKDANQQPFADLFKAWNAFFKKRSKRPTFKKKGKCRDAFYVSNIYLKVEPRRVWLPLIGWVRVRESLRLVGKIMSATVSRDGDGWYISISVEGDFTKKRKKTKAVVGVDLGVKSFAVLSTGETIEGPKPLRRRLKHLRRHQRVLSRRTKGSKRYDKQRRRVALIHKRIRDTRNDFIHKLTTRLCRENQTVVIEDLNVRGMVRNRCLARAISDQGFGEFRHQLTYKAELFGTTLVVADRWFPSSKICSSCGAIKETLALSERVFRCEACGEELDRDLNAARNLRTLGLRGIARGPRVSPVAMKAVRVEASTRQRRTASAVVA